MSKTPEFTHEEASGLEQFPEWTLFKQVLNAKAAGLANEVLAQCETPEEAFRNEFTKGRLAAYLEIEKLPENIIKQHMAARVRENDDDDE